MICNAKYGLIPVTEDEVKELNRLALGGAHPCGHTLKDICNCTDSQQMRELANRVYEDGTGKAQSGITASEENIAATKADFRRAAEMTGQPMTGIGAERDEYSPPTISRTPHRCPVCEGRGHVPLFFYGGRAETSANERDCRTCAGRGVLWG